MSVPSWKWIDDYEDDYIELGESGVTVSVYHESGSDFLPEDVLSKKKEGSCVYLNSQLRKDGDFWGKIHDVEKSEFDGDWDDCPSKGFRLPLLGLVYKKKE